MLGFLHFEGNMFSGYFLDYPSDMTEIVWNTHSCHALWFYSMQGNSQKYPGSPKIRDELKHVTVLHLHTA